MGVFALAATLALLLARFSKVLVIPALLFAGVLLGPHGIGVLRDTAFLEGAGDVGLVLLLFYASLFTHPKALRQGGRIALPLAAYDLVLNLAAAYWVGALFGWDMESRLLLGGVMATSSTGAILKILTDEGRLLRREGQVLIALLWIEDLAFIALYLYLSGRLGLANPMLTWTALVSLVLFVAFLAFLRQARELVWRIPQKEILVPLLTGLGLLGGWLGSLAGLPTVASAFLTGLLLAGSRGARFIQAEAPYLRDLAGALFFLAFGALIDAHVAWRIVPLAGLALLGIVVTELLFLPQAARLLGLTGVEAHVVGASLLARGGKSAAFAQLGADAHPTSHAAEVQGASGILMAVLTPFAPLAVRLALWMRRFERAPTAPPRSRDVLSATTRRVLAPPEFAQKNPTPWWERVLLAEWFVLLLALGVLASLVPYPVRLGPLLAGVLLAGPAYLAARRYVAAIPGAPGNTWASRALAAPRLDEYLPAVLLIPFLLLHALALTAPAAPLAFPVLWALALIVLLALPRLVHPRVRAPGLRRALVHAARGP